MRMVNAWKRLKIHQIIEVTLVNYQKLFFTNHGVDVIPQRDRLSCQRSVWHGMIFGFLVLVCLCFPYGKNLIAAETNPAKPSEPFTIIADSLENDDKLGIITARGHVVISNSEHRLSADLVSYNQTAHQVVASGNVVLVETNGSTTRTSRVELDDQFANGVIAALLIELDANAKLAANQGIRKNGTINELSQATYSPCAPCKDDPDRPLLWQVKAENVVHDSEIKRVIYYDAWLEVYGVPVMYTPYFSHPDPTVKRESGLLAPSFGTSNSLGTYLSLPAYIIIDDHSDITFTPTFTQDAGVLGTVNWRKMIEGGGMELLASYNGDNKIRSEDKDRYLVDFRGQKEFNQQWEGNWHFISLSDENFKADFPFFPNIDHSINKSSTELLGKNNEQYLRIRANYFQDLRTDVTAGQPIILPMVDYLGLTSPDSYGGRVKINLFTRDLLRSDAVTAGQVMSSDTVYSQTSLLSSGLITRFEGGVRGDIYNTGYSDEALADGKQNGVSGRFVPHASVVTSYPLARQTDSYGQQMIEPIIGIFASPNYVGNNNNIPNEDALVYETDDLAILDSSPIPGVDRLESGLRAAAGLKMSQYFATGQTLSGFIGQGYRFHSDPVLAEELNIQKGYSDFVGRLNFIYSDYLSAGYRLSLDEESLRINRNEAQANIGTQALRFQPGYIYLSDNYTSTSTGMERVYGNLTSQITDNWRARVSSQYDILNHNTDSYGAGLTYEDECYIMDFNASRRYRSDSVDESLFAVTLVFKTLGEVTY